MRIAVHLTESVPEEGGGHTFERGIVDTLIARSAASDHDFVLIGEGPEAPPLARDAGVPFVSVRRTAAARLSDKASLAAQRAWRSIRYPAVPSGGGERDTRIDQLLRRERVDMVWTPSPTYLSMDVPFVTTVWDLQHRIRPYFPEVSAGRIWDRREAHFSTLARRAAMVVTGTRVGAEEVRAAYGVPEERLRILPLPTPSFAIAAAAAPGAAHPDRRGGWADPPYILYPAQFWPHKNHVAMLHALGRLRSTYNQEIRAVFVGSDQGNRSHVEACCDELGLRAAVDFRGFVPTSELVELYRGALALVYPSLFGPDNLPPLEAFALGCPVVAADGPGAREQLGDAALLVNPVNEREIADAVRRIGDDPETRERVIAAGRERAASWTESHYVDGVFALFDDFAAIRRAWGR